MKSYSDPNTPAVNYWYDNQTLPFQPGPFNRGLPIGRLVAVTTSSSLGNFYGYDAMGRVNQFYQRVDGGDYGTTNISYNLAGQQTSATYPSGKTHRLDYTYAGRISRVYDPSMLTDYLGGITYAPHGAVASETLGNGLAHQISYNSRLQPTRISLAGAANVLRIGYDYGANNNGNLISQTIVVPGLGAGNLTVASSPAVATYSGNLYVFVQGSDKRLWVKKQEGGSWSEWQSLGGSLASAPAVTSWGPNRLDVFAQGTDNALWHKWWDGVSWGPQDNLEPLGGNLTSAPAVTSWGLNRLDVFVKGLDNALWHLYWNGAWSA